MAYTNLQTKGEMRVRKLSPRLLLAFIVFISFGYYIRLHRFFNREPIDYAVRHIHHRRSPRLGKTVVDDGFERFYMGRFRLRRDADFNDWFAHPLLRNTSPSTGIFLDYYSCRFHYFKRRA